MVAKKKKSKGQDPSVPQAEDSQEPKEAGFEPVLNDLIATSKKILRDSEKFPSGVEYTEYMNIEDYANKVKSLNEKFKTATEKINVIAKKLSAEGGGNHSLLEDLLAIHVEQRALLTSDAPVPATPVNKRVDIAPPPAPEVSSSNDSTPVKKHAKKVADALQGIITFAQVMELENECLVEFPRKVNTDDYKRLQGRPQHNFKDCFDNFSSRFFDPKRYKKCNPIRPQVTISSNKKDPGELKVPTTFNPCIYPDYRYFETYKEPYSYLHSGFPSFQHPYSAELNALNWSEDTTLHSHTGKKITGGGTLFKMTDDTIYERECKYTLVDDVKGLKKMIATLKKEKIIAVDVEHHSEETFRGFVCLVQFSSSKEDWIVDPFKIFGSMNLLNEVMTDPEILKVFHGSDNDIIWLQRDFGVYVVNMFDTKAAAEVLKVPGKRSLDYLLMNLCGVRIDKSYQTADWRKRPLPPEMLKYACGDTHYLIKLYTILKNLALGMEDGREKIIQIMKNGKHICQRQYSEKNPKLIAMARSIGNKYGIPVDKLNRISYNLLFNLLVFRNIAARTLDESESLLLSDRNIATIVRRANSGSFQRFAKAAYPCLVNLGPEIAYIIKLRNTIFDLFSGVEEGKIEIKHQVNLELAKDLSQFKLGTDNEEVNVSRGSPSESSGKMDTSTISSTLEIYKKFVQDGLFNSVAPVNIDISGLRGLVKHETPRIATQETSVVKRSLADEGNVQPPWKRRNLKFYH
ncbi:3'-5' exonuclease domain containing protein [Theileria equi strain WA]|uniref:3'-5' exonuclease domain containing protein n=1 Tax=Theileria equi strain WA TaxID=1537102 RepID=L1LC88_THEEQ|nr:3'-5' exonuclease domain containing protein [Theileria equi strain WA]EKX72865.1 3'-5' exonuclease domain containing protein [Theileria equi strain WA]|eukprot:XP_004832317.1 3'-5' exonuclease domain containing protein [Theileria equi strain WA]